MPDPAVLLFTLVILAFSALDLSLLISLIRPGDERRQMIVWKASTATFGGLVGYFFLCVLNNLIRGYESINPLTLLTVTAMLYFAFLLYFRKKNGS